MEENVLSSKLINTEEIKETLEEIKKLNQEQKDFSESDNEYVDIEGKKKLLEEEIVEKQKKLLDTEELEKRANDILEEEIRNKEIEQDDEKIAEEKVEEENIEKNKIEIPNNKKSFNLNKYKKIIFIIILVLAGMIFLKIKNSSNAPVIEDNKIEVANNDIIIKDINEEDDDENKAFTLNEDVVKVASDNPTIEYELISKEEAKKQDREIIGEKMVDKDEEEIKKIDNEIKEIDNSFSGQNNRSTQIENKNNSMSFIKKEAKNRIENNDSNKNTNLNTNLTNKIQQNLGSSLMQGSIIPALLISEINTDLPGDIIAQVRENVYDTRTGNVLLIPKGARLYGRYNAQIAKGQNRVMLAFDKIVLPNGKYINLSKMDGVDGLGRAGLNDKVDNHTLEIFKNALFATTLNFADKLTDAAIGALSFKFNKIIGATDKKESKNENSFRNATSKILERTVDKKPTLIIKKGFLFNILVNGDIELEKYE